MIHKDCYGTVLLVWSISLVFAFVILRFIPWTFISYPLAVIPMFFMGFVLFFFRVPDRQSIGADNDVTSVADGKSVVIDKVYEGEYLKSVSTNSEGEVNLLVDKGASYAFVVEYDGKDVTGGLRAAELGEDKVNTVVVNISKCSCACHGDGIWSAIFRFFHKIIKMFTGEFKCCNDPDPRYN